MRLETERLLLRGARCDKEQIEQEIDWLNDPEVVKYSEQRHMRHTFGSQYAYIRSFNWPNMLWEIHIKNGDFIGTLSVYVDAPNKIADMGILIGAKGEWGKGYGTEAWRSVMKYIWVTTDTKRITAGCMEHNDSMIAVAANSGMKMCGVANRRFLFEGGRVSAVYYGIER